MTWKTTNRLVGGFVFLYALVLYVLTVAPTASFWDAGEFIAIAHGLQVSHPPGAPFYMLVGRLFSIVLTPILGLFHEYSTIALAINLVSVLSSALTILLTHLIIVRLVREWQGPEEGRTAIDRIAALTGGVIGALTFAATDSFWFNAVEAEVYAMSMFFTAAAVWLIMRWSDRAQEEEAQLARGEHPFSLSSNRYLVLIAYLFGIAIGVHLLNLLAVFFIALIFYFTAIERGRREGKELWMGVLLAGVVSVIAFLVIYPGVIQWLPQIAGASGSPLLVVLAVIALTVFAVYYTQKNRMPVANLMAVSIAVVLIGYSSYALIFIRSAADPPIDENDPETTEAIVSYLKREQYGETPLLRGASYNNALGRLDESREKLFPRRHSPDPSHMQVYRQYDSDWEFFWEYQVGHMYVRYLLWNFVGRASDVQDAPPITGIGFIDARIPGADDYYQATPSERASRNGYFAIPLLLGLIGASYHFRRDWRRAFSVLVLFLVTGIGIILYLNQTPLQPRERDYSYVASFFAFSLWVGIGATGVIELLHDGVRHRLRSRNGGAVALAAAAVLFLAVPLWMTVENYDDHDRSGQFVAPDYAYNMLMSVEEDGILFTNGDNDTFPLWYLQEVEEVRRDVRVVNLSLLNTSWYIKQLKNQASRESEPLPISLSNEQIESVSVVRWDPQQVELPVDVQQLASETELYLPTGDTAGVESPMRWFLQGRPYPFSDQFSILYAADLATLDILRTNASQGWTRPIYFAVTVSPDGQLDLQNYLHLEGQAFQVLPIRHDTPMGRVTPETAERLLAFRFRNIADPGVYFDENIRRMVDNYRNVFGHTAEQLALQGETDLALQVLDKITTEVPFETVSGDERSYLLLARAYAAAGRNDRSVELIEAAQPIVLHRLEGAASGRELELAARYIQMIRFSLLEAGAYEEAAAFSSQVADALNDPSYRQTPEELRRLYEQARQGIPPAAPAPAPAPTDSGP